MPVARCGLCWRASKPHDMSIDSWTHVRIGWRHPRESEKSERTPIGTRLHSSSSSTVLFLFLLCLRFEQDHSSLARRQYTLHCKAGQGRADDIVEIGHSPISLVWKFWMSGSLDLWTGYRDQVQAQAEQTPVVLGRVRATRVALHPHAARDTTR